MRDVFIAGTGMTKFGRHLDKTYNELSAAATLAALEDAGCAKHDVDMAIYGNVAQGSMTDQIVVRGQFALRPLGFAGIPIFNIENACATSSTGLKIAFDYVRTGLAEAVLVVGTEKLYSEDRVKRFAVFNQTPDLEQAEAYLARYGDRLADMPPQNGDDELGSVLMDCYAAQARLHMKRFGTTQRQLAVIAAKNHDHSVHNPLAQYQKTFTVEEILASKVASWPLTVPMCAPISDGATAAVICSADAMKHFSGNGAAVRILGAGFKSGSDRDPERIDQHVSRLAADAAYEMAGIGPDDVDAVELHDASSYAEVIEAEALRLCPDGEGGPHAESGASTLGGRQPINPSGGLESRGHPLAATGLAQIHHLKEQLRGSAGKAQIEDARIALAQTGGGFIGVEEAVSCVTLLGRA